MHGGVYVDDAPPEPAAWPVMDASEHAPTRVEGLGALWVEAFLARDYGEPDSVYVWEPLLQSGGYTSRTSELVAHLKEHGILVTGLNYPVVPKGDESIRFQVSAEHTATDIDYAIEVLRKALG